ncbi:MAG: hypothetical protein ACRCY7_03230 [Cetobacterium sp.]|uniref:hypothetical protein n=1 Tax=Cetobacterium sp. TaxID=2071632 RepID=UPI003F310B92
MEENIKIEGINNIYKVNRKEKYWLFRAGDKARYFDNFYFNKRIGIAWDKINRFEQISTYDILKSEVEKLYPEEDRPGNIYNKIYKFTHEMKAGDIIIMPDSDRKRVAFGKIVENEITIGKIFEQKQLLHIKNDKQESKVEPGAINKYRKVEWINLEMKDRLSNKLLLHLFSPHSISQLSNDIKYDINKILNDIFIIDNKLYLRYNVNTENDIYARDIGTFYQLIKYTEKVIAILSDEEEKIETKINVSSPGDIVAIMSCSALILAVANYMLNGGFIKFNYKDEVNFEVGGGKSLYDYIEQRHRHKIEDKKIEQLERVLNIARENIPEEEFKNMVKNLELNPPKLENIEKNK